MRLPTVSPADLHSEPGPRSLDPDRPFWSAYAELIRGQPSPIDPLQLEHDVRANKTGALDPHRDGGLDLLPFLTYRAFSLAGAAARGESRNVRSYSPSEGSSRLRGFAQP